MRAVFVNLHRNRASMARRTAMSLSLLAVLPGAALAQNPNSNIRQISCPGTSQTFFLCKDGNNCNAFAGESPQDIVIVNGVTANDTISFEVSHPGGANNISPIVVNVDGNGSGTVYSDSVTVPPTDTTSPYLVTAADAADTQSRFKIEVDPTANTIPQPKGFARIGYKVTCTKAQAGTGSITIVKNAVGGTGAFDFTGTAPLGGFIIDTAVTSTQSFPNLTPGTFTITETPEAGFTFTSLACTGDNFDADGTGATLTANVHLDAGENVTCTYTNTKQGASLTLTKTPTPASFTDVGQLITYALVVTNTGDVPLTNVTITDPGAGLVLGSCVPALPAILAASPGPGNSATCTATHVVTAADVTNLCFDNTATATGNNGMTVLTANASAQVCLKPDKTKETIRNFLNRRVDLLASNEPDRARMQRRFDRPQQPAGSLKDEPPMKLSGSAENGRSEFSFATSLSQIAQANAAASHAKMAAARPDGQMNLGAADDGRTPMIPAYPQVPGVDVWVEGHFQKWDDDLGTSDNSGRFGILYVGADYLVSPWILVGALVQFDWMDDESKKLNTDVSGNGWLAGPYVTLKLSDNIMFDARGAWGQSDNDISPFGTYTDSFDTDRWLAKANLTGNWYAGALRISPSVGVIYVEETQHAYVDSLGFTIDSQSVHIGRLTFGPEFGYAIQSSDGTIIEPHVSFTGMWDFDKDSTATVGGLTTSRDDFRVKVEGGLMVRATDGLSARATVSYDGIGSDDLNAWGGQLWLSVPLN